MRPKVCQGYVVMLLVSLWQFLLILQHLLMRYVWSHPKSNSYFLKYCKLDIEYWAIDTQNTEITISKRPNLSTISNYIEPALAHIQWGSKTQSIGPQALVNYEYLFQIGIFTSLTRKCLIVGATDSPSLPDFESEDLVRPTIYMVATTIIRHKCIYQAWVFTGSVRGLHWL